MALTPEGRVKEAVKRYLKTKGAWYYMPVQNGMGVVGVPDFICCWEGQFIAIETKAPGKANTTTPNQDRQINSIRNAGGIAIVVDDVKDVERMFAFLESEGDTE